MIRRFAVLLVPVSAMLGLLASPALAAPAWEVQITRDEPEVSRSDMRVDYTVVVENVGSDPTAGPLTVEVELPAGSQTRVRDLQATNWGPAGWSCERHLPVGAQPATAICQRTGGLPLPPGASFDGGSALVIAALLGEDAPDLAIAQATVSGGGAPAASATDEFVFGPPLPFEIAAFETAVENPDGSDYEQAGGHPHRASSGFQFTFARGPSGGDEPIERVKNIIVDVPRGFIGNALAIPLDDNGDPDLCPSLDQVLAGTCPLASLVGGIDLDALGGISNLAVYAVEPEFGVPAQFAFSYKLSETTYTFVPRLRATDNYAISFEASPVVVNPPLRGVPKVTLCDFGATRQPSGEFGRCKEADEPDPDGDGPLGPNDVALITTPTRCEGELPTSTLRVDSWKNPGVFKTRQTTDPLPTGCDKVPFEPSVDLRTIGGQADSPTGLEVELAMPTDGLINRKGIAQASLKRTRVYFPEGMAINPSAGHGLQACAKEQVKLETNLPIECPAASKVGTIEIDTPLIQETLTGATYVAKQSDAPPGALIGLYLVFESAKDGIIIKIPGGVKPDPVTGQLVATFDELPEQPFSKVTMKFPQGPRASLLAPPRCGAYEFKAEFVPWTIGDLANPTAAETVTRRSSFKVTEGPGGKPCPTGALEPTLDAGTSHPVAGELSPFVMRLTREDGSQRFSALDLQTPPGLTAYLRGIPYCSDEALASISGAVETGQAQIDNPTCPAASQIGTASAGAGAGPDPFYVNTGKAYLAGPYKGAPLSLALVAPAVAGPLDLGNVVVRTALHVDPETAQITAVSDPIPTILHGILLDLRDIRVAIDRPRFTLNPTNCEPMSVRATVKGDKGATATPASRFQVDGCHRLKFGPKLHTRLFGPTHRGGHPRLRGVLTAGPGEANIARAAVTIPRSEFLDQAHIRTICTRVQFAAKNCPQGAVYGHAKAFTPLLDYPVEGPVYLRSSDNKLPDLVAALRGPAHQPIEAVVVGRVDSIKGQIRTTFAATPDVPVSKFILTMQGGSKGLLVNSRNICARAYRATVKLTGHNGRRSSNRPVMRNGKCAKERRTKRRAHKR